MENRIPVERRIAPRYRCSGSASIWQYGTNYAVSATVADISASGCYAELMTPMSVGTKVKLLISVQGLTIRTPAEVRTSHPGVGMGLQFQNVDESDRAILNQLIDQLSKAAAGQENAEVEIPPQLNPIQL